MHLCALCTSTLHTHLNTHSLVSSMFSRGITSLKVSSFTLSSYSLPMNCSVNNLSGSVYSHSATFVQSAHLFLGRLIAFSMQVWYCDESMIQLWCSLNFLLSTENSPLWFCILLFAPALKIPWATGPPNLTNSL